MVPSTSVLNIPSPGRDTIPQSAVTTSSTHQAQVNNPPHTRPFANHLLCPLHLHIYIQAWDEGRVGLLQGAQERGGKDTRGQTDQVAA